MQKRNIPTDLALVIFFTLLCIPLVLIPPLNEISPVRIILGLPLVLFLPGYALIATLFPRNGDLEGIERIALSFGLSIAISPLLGFALNYTPFGIRLTPVLTVLSLFTIALAIGAWARRSKILDEDMFGVDFGAFFRSIDLFKSKDTKIGRILTIMEIKLNGEVIDQKGIVLTHNETWEGPFTFKAKKAGEDQKLEFLYSIQGRSKGCISLT